MWNYRICKNTRTWESNGKKDESVDYGIHEVYYNKDGEIWAVTENPKSIVADLCEFSCEDEAECITSLKNQMEMMQKAFKDDIVDLDTIVFANNENNT